jgi:hypothetical protein
MKGEDMDIEIWLATVLYRYNIYICTGGYLSEALIVFVNAQALLYYYTCSLARVSVAALFIKNKSNETLTLGLIFVAMDLALVIHNTTQKESQTGWFERIFITQNSY